MTLPKKLARLTQSRRNTPRDRGAVLVEAAIAIPLLLLVILGSMEMGFAWDAKSSTVSGVRTGTLRAASVAGDPTTDLLVLQSVIGEIGADNVDQLNYVMIFDANTPNRDQAILDCSNGGGSCALYDDATFFDEIAATTNAAALLARFDDGTNLTAAPQYDPVTGALVTPGSYNCAPGLEDSGSFCAGARTVNGDAEIGIAVSYSHEWVSGIFPFSPPVFNEDTVTSTFVAGGADISPTNQIPSGIGVVGSTDFESGVIDGGLGVTNGGVPGPLNTFIPPNLAGGSEVLGLFGKDDTLTYEVQTPQADPNTVRLCLSFTIYSVGSWDNERFEVDLNGDGTPEYSENFHQGDAGRVQFLAGSGNFNEAGRARVSNICIDHTGPIANIDFSSTLNQATTDESWAIDDITVTVSSL